MGRSLQSLVARVDAALTAAATRRVVWERGTKAEAPASSREIQKKVFMVELTVKESTR
jgi:hypothetical protein